MFAIRFGVLKIPAYRHSLRGLHLNDVAYDFEDAIKRMGTALFITYACATWYVLQITVANFPVVCFFVRTQSGAVAN